MIEGYRAARAHDRGQQDDLRVSTGTPWARSAPPTMPMTKPYNRRCAGNLDEQLKTVSFAWRGDFLGPQELVRPMPLKACRLVHRAEVVERAIFATRNSLKSHVGRNLKSPFSNTRAITPKLCPHSRPTAVENHPGSKAKLRGAINSR